MTLLQWFNVWELRLLLLLSFSLQVFLLVAMGLRRRCKTLLIFFLWGAYLMADNVALYAFGLMSLKIATGTLTNPQFMPLWASFLLLHLGAQDNITAYSLQDIELWGRHLMRLFFHLCIVVYIFVKFRSSTRFLIPSIFILITGSIKYVERVWALICASQEGLKEDTAAGKLKVNVAQENIVVDHEDYIHYYRVGERRCQLHNVKNKIDKPFESYKKIVWMAHKAFRETRGIFVNVIYFGQLGTRLDHFRNFASMPLELAYQVIGIELGLYYDIFYTKSTVIHTWYGRFLRVLLFLLNAAALEIFCSISKQGYDPADVDITYVLLVGAFVLDVCAIVKLVFSSWSFWELWAHSNDREDRFVQRLRWAANVVVYWMWSFRVNKRLWSGYIGQFDFFQYCITRQRIRNIMELIMVPANVIKVFPIDWLARLLTTRHVQVKKGVKKLILEELQRTAKNMFKQINDRPLELDLWTEQRRCNTYRGENTLSVKAPQLKWSVTKTDFEESVLIWHIATEMCFAQDNNNTIKYLQLASVSMDLSRYMLHLIIRRHTVLPGGGIRRSRYEKTFEEVANMGDPAQQEPVHDQKVSVLTDAAKVAEVLMKMTSAKDRWDTIGALWVEMLCYAARTADGRFHAKHLTMGGELLSFVWILLVHLGLGDFYAADFYPPGMLITDEGLAADREKIRYQKGRRGSSTFQTKRDYLDAVL